ncbi:hypothetical protein [Alkalicoccus urumqiensis]|uniref:General stress protein 17M-like domain-containing protein n=1 Tax=Alkalicoccus urumqiensis TaxID=1548213 RepID=A0A2P6MDC0_ALKUR|nr:hypothetical protein [Alkalicoccus urumqiensis]PRO64278.1 hypothetical protein C6I21_15515 [Alkalicoccus urumqiensis]
MTTHMQVYFTNENGAEDLSTSIQKYNVSNVRVEHIPDLEENRTMMMIPAGSIGSAGSSQGGQPGLFASFQELRDSLIKDKKPAPDYLLQFDVADEHKSEVLEEIKKTDGYVDKEISDN